MGALRRLAATTAALAVGRSVLRRAHALSVVAPDLRNPLAFLPLAPGSSRHLSLVRTMMKRDIAVPVPAGVTLESVTAVVDGRPSTRVVTYQRADRSRPSGALLWIHGGGTVIGRPEQGNALCGRWADELGLFVASVDYRLAPEHPFPAGLEDCYTALSWLHREASPLGVNADRIAVGGDSAGGLLAASLCQIARDRSGPPIQFQLLEYPMLDDRTVLRADPGLEQSLVWSPKASRFGWTSYLGGPPHLDHAPPFAAPARTTDLRVLPDTWIGVGSIDLLHDEAVDYARRLADADVRCELYVEPGMYHGADSLPFLADAPTARRFRDRMTAALGAAVKHP